MRKQLRLKGWLILTLMSSLCIYLLVLSRGNHSRSTHLSGGNSLGAAHSKIRVTQVELGVASGDLRLTREESVVASLPTYEGVNVNSTRKTRGQTHLDESLQPIIPGNKHQTGEVTPKLSPKQKNENNATNHNSSAQQNLRNSLKLNDVFRAEMESKMAAIEVLSQPIINDHNFEYLRNPEGACADSLMELLIVVPSAPENLQKRMQIRKGPLGDYVRTASNNAKLVFFVGEAECKEHSAKFQRDVDDEFQNYKDIVQEQFLDAYKNIRLKAVSMLRWAVTFCRQAKYVIRTDDDVIVNVTKIVSVMKKKGSELPDFILGDRKDGWRPVRRNSTYGLKYLVDKEEYPNSTYPPFAVGGLLGYPMSTVSLLYQAALRIKPIWLDDVYITGICAQRLKLPLIKDPDFVFQHHN